jgi:prolyl-tRNA synthetase
VPVRLEVGPRDLANGEVTLVRRDDGTKVPTSVGSVAGAVPGLLDTIQQSLHDAALAARDARTVAATSVAEAAEVAAGGFARLLWADLGEGGEEELATSAVTVRCLLRPDGSVPDSDTEPGLEAVVGRSY